MILRQITIPKLSLKFPKIKTLQMAPSHLDKWLFRYPFKGVKISPQKLAPLEETHPFKGCTILSLPLFLWIL